MANYFRSENFETLKRKNIHNLISLFTNCWYKNTLLNLIINILVFRIFLFVFGTLFLSLGNFEILVSKIINHMGENHRTVPLALINFSKMENFNRKIFVYVNNYKVTKLLYTPLTNY